MHTNEKERTKVRAIKFKITQSRIHQILHLSLIICIFFFFSRLCYFLKICSFPTAKKKKKAKAVVSIEMN